MRQGYVLVDYDETVTEESRKILYRETDVSLQRQELLSTLFDLQREYGSQLNIQLVSNGWIVKKENLSAFSETAEYFPLKRGHMLQVIEHQLPNSRRRSQYAEEIYQCLVTHFSEIAKIPGHGIPRDQLSNGWPVMLFPEVMADRLKFTSLPYTVREPLTSEFFATLNEKFSFHYRLFHDAYTRAEVADVFPHQVMMHDSLASVDQQHYLAQPKSDLPVDVTQKLSSDRRRFFSLKQKHGKSLRELHIISQHISEMQSLCFGFLPNIESVLFDNTDYSMHCLSTFILCDEAEPELSIEKLKTSVHTMMKQLCPAMMVEPVQPTDLLPMTQQELLSQVKELQQHQLLVSPEDDPSMQAVMASCLDFFSDYLSVNLTREIDSWQFVNSVATFRLLLHKFYADSPEIQQRLFNHPVLNALAILAHRPIPHPPPLTPLYLAGGQLADQLTSVPTLRRENAIPRQSPKAALSS